MFTPYKPQNSSGFTPISDTLIKKYQEQPKKDSIIDRTAEDQVAGFNYAKEGIQKGADQYAINVEKAKNNPSLLGALKDEFAAAGGLLRGGTRLITGGTQAILAPVSATISKGIDYMKESNPDKVKNKELFPSLQTKIESIASTHPELVKDINDVVNIASILLGGSKTVTAPLEQALSKDAITVASKDVLNSAKNTVTTVKNIPATLAEKNAAKETIKLTETISPKLTSKEIKLAEKQGRIKPGQDPTLLRGGTPDTVIPSDKIIRATETIQREIPGASKLKEPELYTALEGRTSDMAMQLKPELQKIPVKPETIEKINIDWESIKKSQIENAPATEEINVFKRQKKFQSFLEKSDSKNLDDLWETRKKYDNSIPENVKKANINSPESLQIQKEEWLQNREILNSAITDAKNGMGEAAQKSFDAMHDMYNAKENLLSKAKIEFESKPSKIKQWVKENPWKAAVAGYVTGKAIENTTGINIPGI